MRPVGLALRAVSVGVAGWMAACARPVDVQRERLEFQQAQQTAVAARPTATPPNSIAVGPGRLIDVGGHRLYIECLGSGSPTIVMDVAADPHRRSWDAVLDEVKTLTQVCIYDRAGTGASENAAPPRTSQQITRELRSLLTNAGLHGPFVLVGHGFGGMNVRLHASLYPDDVSGLVLLDPFEEQSFLAYVSALTQDQLAGYVRLVTATGEGLDPLASALQMAAAAPLHAMPSVVIASRKGVPAATHDHLRALSQRVPGSQLVFADDSRTYVQIDQPSVVVSAIRQVVGAIRG